MQIIDLSQDIYEGMKVYPGHLKTVQFEHATHEETEPRFEGGFSFQTTGFMLNDNGPTHVDSFSHLDPTPGAETIDQMSLDLFYGPAVCLDVTGFAPQTDINAATSTGSSASRRSTCGAATSCCSTPPPGTSTPGTSAT
jgi:kynurenine formamidase